ncbi:MAG: glycosyltransferase family 4 protein [Candidatus Firestonebacteria bacterium]|nr:glycosyltransferase family 4 protein [Candidatus Firestonebacteria bacterium]
MKIGINAITINKHKTGIGTYTYELLKHLLEIDKKNEYIVFLPEDSTMDFHAENLKLVYIKANINKPLLQLLWENVYLPGLIKKKNIDIFFSPSFVLPFFSFKSKSVITVHDLAYIIFPETKSFLFGKYIRFIVPRSVRKADRIICDSKSTQDDLIKYYKTSGEKSIVIHLGCNLSVNTFDSSLIFKFREKYELKNNYIVYIGNDDPRKNLSRLIQSFKLLKEKPSGRDMQLVLIGKRRKEEKLTLMVKQLGIEHDVKFIDYLKENELNLAYAGAKLLVYPSIYEGFGLPILEAMACGIPVLTSNISSMPEIADDAAVFVNPYDVENICMGMESILKDNKLREALIDKGFQRIKKFSWLQTAEKTLEVFKSLEST